MKKKPGSYRHGNLRATLISLGLEAVERDGAEGVSFRSLAEAAGVSKNAPYRHFKDKEEFIGIIADEGFHMLYDCLLQAGNNLEKPEDTLSAVGKAYMIFAVEHPALYRLMNSPVLCSLPDELAVWARRSLGYLQEVLETCLPRENPGDSRLDIHSRIASAWAYIHGLVLLRIDNLFPEYLPEPKWDLLAGLIP